MRQGLKIGIVVLFVIIVFIIILTALNRKKIKDQMFHKIYSHHQLFFHTQPLKPLIPFPVLFINLKESQDRLRWMETQLSFYRCSGHRINAVDRKVIQTKNLHKGLINDPEFYHHFINHYQSKTKTKMIVEELGCTFSHIKAIYHAYKNHLGTVMIVEDDCSFHLSSMWPESISDLLQRAPSDWTILQLHIFNNKKGKNFDIVLHNVKNPCLSTCCYIINTRGQETIINKVFGNSKTLILGNRSHKSTHGQADYFIYGLTTSYYVSTPLMVPMDSHFTSTIHSTHKNTHNKNIYFQTTLYRNIHPWLWQNSSLMRKQLLFAQTLLDMREMLHSYRIRFFLTEGTLLGAYRDNNFIKGDNDIDLGIFIHDYRSQVEKGNHFFYLYKKLGSHDYGLELTFQHRLTKIFVDLFLFYPDKNGYWLATYNNLCDTAKHQTCRWHRGHFTLSSMSFLNHSFQVPHPTEEYLIYSYGEDWNIPHSYSYQEGLSKGYYHGLIKQDFSNPPEEPKRKRVRPHSWWPKKILEHTKPFLWMYWENEKPAYLDLCFQTVKKHCEKSFEIVILNDDLFETISRTAHSNFRHIFPLAMRADYIRFTLLSEYGGVWLDSDTIVLQDLIHIFKKTETFSLIACRDHETDFSIGVLFAKRGNLICSYHKHIFETHPRFSRWINKPTTLNWNASTVFANSYINSMLSSYPNELHILNLPQIHWKQSLPFFWKEGNLQPQMLQLPFVLLHNQTYTDQQKTYSKKQVLDSKWRISKLFHHSLFSKIQF